jgi:hypothetical protein
MQALRPHFMPRSPFVRASVVALITILIVVVSRFVQSQTVAIRVAGDEWFLDSITKAQVIPGFEKQTSIQVEILHRNDQTIMSDLDRGIQPGDVGLGWS